MLLLENEKAALVGGLGIALSFSTRQSSEARLSVAALAGPLDPTDCSGVHMAIVYRTLLIFSCPAARRMWRRRCRLRFHRFAAEASLSDRSDRAVSIRADVYALMAQVLM